jgi:hypothetical protein
MRILAWLGLSCLLCACGGDEGASGPERCTSASCAPLYTPEFSEIFQRTLIQKCAVGDGTCHTDSGAKGGLSFSDADQAYAELLGDSGEPARVLAGDPRCSELIYRLEAGGSVGMPPGKPLSEAERCSIRLWVEQGAAR